MKATRIHGAKDIRLDDVAEPGPPGPRQLLVAPMWCGICGSDLKGYLGKSPYRYGKIMGHEFSARVVEAGSDVQNVKDGDRVSVMPITYCHECPSCLLGDYEFCTGQSMAGLHGDAWKWGGLGDLALIDDYQAFPLDGIADDEAAVVEPAAVAVHTMLKTNVRPGDTAAVIGCGPIGSLVTMALRAFGVEVVLAVDPNPHRAEAVVRFGAARSVVSATSEQESADLLAILGPMNVDFVFDCIGAEGTVNLAIHGVRVGGTIGLASGGIDSKVIDVMGIQHRAVTIVGSNAYTLAAWHRTIDLIHAGHFPAGEIITSRITRSEIVERGFKSLLDPTTEDLKVLVHTEGAH